MFIYIFFFYSDKKKDSQEGEKVIENGDGDHLPAKKRKTGKEAK
jgi:hypothetical protein